MLEKITKTLLKKFRERIQRESPRKLVLDELRGDSELEKTSSAAYKGHLLLDEDRFSEAEIVFNKALVVKPNDPYAHFGLGLVYSQFKEYEKSILHYDLAIQNASNKWCGLAVSYNNKANSLFGLNRIDEALANLDKSNEIDPELSLPYFTKGIHFYHNGDFDKALELLSQSIEKNPNLALPYQLRSEIYKMKGNRKKEKKELKKARKCKDYTPVNPLFNVCIHESSKGTIEVHDIRVNF